MNSLSLLLPLHLFTSLKHLGQASVSKTCLSTRITQDKEEYLLIWKNIQGGYNRANTDNIYNLQLEDD